MKSLVLTEWKLLARDRTIVVFVLLLAGLFLIAAWNGRRFARERGAEVERLETLAAEETAADRAKVAAGDVGGEPWTNPGNPYRRKAVATLPPAPLGGFAVGMTDLQSYWSNVSIYTLATQPFRLHELGNPLNRLVGSFDLAFVVVFLLPLLVLALGFDLLSAERERGTLALVVAQGASPRRLAVAKVLARGLLVAVFATVLSLLAAALAAGGPGSAEVAPRLLGWIVVVWLYGAFWFALALFVQTLGRSSATNALLLGGAWLLFVVIAPAAVHLTASSLHPVPSRHELVLAERRADTEAARVREKLLEKFALDHPELLPADQPVDWSDFTKSYYASRLDLEERLAPAARQFEERLAAQQEVVGRYRFASPAVVTHEALLDLAGSGHTRHRRFVAEIRGFLETWRQVMVPKIFRGQTLGPEDFDQLPVFRFEEESPGEVRARLLPALAGLALPSGLLALWSFRRLHRSPVLAG